MKVAAISPPVIARPNGAFCELRGEESIAELCRKEGINQNLYYRW